MSERVFTTSDLICAVWIPGGHNRRTKAAFEWGVHDAVLGEPLTKRYSLRDYSDAFYAGYRAALVRINAGKKWRCSECEALHPVPTGGDR